MNRQTKADEIILDQLDLEWCQHCQDYTENRRVTVEGRKGHPEYWREDEVHEYCDDCMKERV
jgi:hypothetical protein